VPNVVETGFEVAILVALPVCSVDRVGGVLDVSVVRELWEEK